MATLDDGASKASVCRSFKVPCSTLTGALGRIRRTGAGVPAGKAKQSAAKPQIAVTAAAGRG